MKAKQASKQEHKNIKQRDWQAKGRHSKKNKTGEGGAKVQGYHFLEAVYGFRVSLLFWRVNLWRHTQFLFNGFSSVFLCACVCCSVTVLTKWVAPPKMVYNWSRV